MRRCVWVRLRDGVGSSSGGLAAGAAVPDSDGGALDGVLAAELAHVAGVLCNLINGCERGVLRAFAENHRGMRTSIFFTCLRSEAP